MKMYFSIFRIRFINSIQYRSVAVTALITSFIWAFMEILAYFAIYNAGNNTLPMTLNQAVSYAWMKQILMTLFLVVFGDGEIYSSIREGNIAYELVRPMNLYGRWFCKSAANRIAFTVLNCIPLILVALVMPRKYRLVLPQDPAVILLFCISVILALCVVVAFAMLMYIALFYTLSHRGIKIIVTAVTTFLSGGIIPITFFSKEVLTVVRWLPFAAMQNIPLRIFNGDIVGDDILRGIVFQMVWFLLLIGIGQVAMRISVKKVVVQGG